MKKDARKEMSVFLDRQSVRHRQSFTKRLRQAERALLSVAIVLAGLAALYGLYAVVVLGDTFSVRRIAIEGEWRSLTAQGIAAVSNVREGDHLFWVSVDDVHRRVSADPWVRSVAVARRLPDTLWIYVEEHRPAAILSADEGLFYIDAEGALFKRVEADDDKSLPVFTGIPLEEGSVLGEEGAGRIREMLSLCDLFRASAFGAAREIAEAHFDRMSGYSLIAGEPPVHILFGQTALAQRVASLDRMRQAIQERGGRIQYMRADEPGRIIVKYHDSA